MSFIQISKGATIRLLLITICFCSAGIVSGKGYYINSQSGLDTNAGTSASVPWKTSSKAKTASLQAGDTLYFASGSLFKGGLEITASGSSDHPIVLTAYGPGDAPKFSNPDLSVLNGNAIRLSGNYLVVDGLYFFYWNFALVYLLTGSQFAHLILDGCIWKSKQ